MLLDKHHKGPKCHIPARPMSFHPRRCRSDTHVPWLSQASHPALWGTAPATSDAFPGVGSLATQDTPCHCASPCGSLQTLQLCPGKRRGDPASASLSAPLLQQRLLTVCLCVSVGASHNIPHCFIIPASVMLIWGQWPLMSLLPLFWGCHDCAHVRQRRT